MSVALSTTNPRRFHLRVEDVALFAWLVLRPLVTSTSDNGGGTGVDPVGGLLDLVGLCAAAAALTARRADATHTGLLTAANVQWIVGPAVGAVALALTDCSQRLGLTDGLGALPVFLPVAVAIGARIWLPPTTAPIRRALLTPFILATSGFFSGIMDQVASFFDLRQVSTWSGVGIGLTLLAMAVAVSGVAIFYVMLIYAPRQLAEREGTPIGWIVRFLVFLAGLTLGATLTGFLHAT